MINKNVFFQNRRIGRSCLGIDTSGRGEDIREGCRKVSILKLCVLVHKNEKMRTVETILRMGRGGIRRIM
jgi:hypothetical protein